MKNSGFSAESICGLNELWGQHTGLMTRMWPLYRRERMYSSIKLVSVFHRRLLSTEAGVTVLVLDSGADHVSIATELPALTSSSPKSIDLSHTYARVTHSF